MKKFLFVLILSLLVCNNTFAKKNIKKDAFYELIKEKEIICNDETKSLSKKSLITDLTKIKKTTKSKLKIILNI